MSTTPAITSHNTENYFDKVVTRHLREAGLATGSLEDNRAACENINVEMVSVSDDGTSVIFSIPVGSHDVVNPLAHKIPTSSRVAIRSREVGAVDGVPEQEPASIKVVCDVVLSMPLGERVGAPFNLSTNLSGEHGISFSQTCARVYAELHNQDLTLPPAGPVFLTGKSCIEKFHKPASAQLVASASPVIYEVDGNVALAVPDVAVSEKDREKFIKVCEEFVGSYSTGEFITTTGRGWRVMQVVIPAERRDDLLAFAASLGARPAYS